MWEKLFKFRILIHQRPSRVSNPTERGKQIQEKLFKYLVQTVKLICCKCYNIQISAKYEKIIERGEKYASEIVIHSTYC